MDKDTYISDIWRQLNDLKAALQAVENDRGSEHYKEGYIFSRPDMHITYIPHHFYLEFINSDNHKCFIPISPYVHPTEFQTIESKEELIDHLEQMVEKYWNYIDAEMAEQ